MYIFHADWKARVGYYLGHWGLKELRSCIAMVCSFCNPNGSVTELGEHDEGLPFPVMELQTYRLRWTGLLSIALQNVFPHAISVLSFKLQPPSSLGKP